MPQPNEQDLSDLVLITVWRRIPILSTRARMIPGTNGVLVQRSPILVYFAGLFGLAMLGLYISMMLGYLDDPEESLEPIVIGVGGFLMCLSFIWMGLGDSLGLSVVEYRDRIEYRRFFRKKVIYYQDITDFDFILRHRGDGYTLVVTNHPQGLPDGEISDEDRRVGGVSTRVKAEDATKIRIHPFTVLPNVTKAHVLMLMAGCWTAERFSDYLIYKDDQFKYLPPYLLREAFVRIYERTGVRVDSEYVLHRERTLLRKRYQEEIPSSWSWLKDY